MLFKHLSVFAFAAQALAHDVPTLAEALKSTPELSTLGTVLGLNKALVDTLTAAKDITILAPTNDAFAALGNDTLTALSKNIPLLTAILEYHVVGAVVPSTAFSSKAVFASTLLTNKTYTTVTGGQKVKGQLVDGKVVLTSGLAKTSTVVKADVKFTGGVVHLIDKVLTVPESASDTLKDAGLTSLRSALVSADLVKTVESTKDITVFAPNNAAFEAAAATIKTLTAAQVSSVLTYHVVAGAAPGYSSSLTTGQKLKTVNGAEVTVTIADGKVSINKAKVVLADVLLANGVAHVIDAVLVPSASSSSSSY